VSAEPQRDLLIHTAPFLKHGVSTPRLMADVLLALVPLLAAAVWFFGAGALLVVAAATIGAVVTELVLGPVARRGESLRDNTAVLTGVLLGLTLPPGIPLWMAFLGGVVAIGLGKLIWGGLGNNLFNPALVGRAFLQAAFPTTLTTWAPPGGGVLSVNGANLALPLMRPAVDAVSSATPLALMKFSHEGTDLLRLLVGNTGGSLGETSAGLIILAALWLAARRSFDWRIPVSAVVSVALFTGILFAIDPQKFPSPLFMVLSGGLLFGAVFMATDPVTSPIAPRGAWAFGIGIGFLVVLIRVFGGLPEGVMYAILLMNAVAPHIDRYAKPRPFGRRGKA